METPLGSGAAPILVFFIFHVFLCITPRQTVLFVGDLARAKCKEWADRWVHAYVCVPESEWERQEERDENKVGGMERMNEKREGQG